METERLRITLSNAEKAYYAGETIKGEIWLNISKRTKIRAIKVQITGKGKCKWMEILRKTSNNDAARSLFYSSKEIYAHNENALPFFEPRGVELNPGEHKFDFSMPLDWNLPSSFKGSHGSIKYKLRILIQRPWTFDERHIIPLSIVKHMPLPLCYRANPTSLEKQITKTITLFGARPITMFALLPEDSVVRGEALRICVTVTNNSTTNVEKLRFSVVQFIWYYSHVPLRVRKMECVTIANKETGSVQKKSERSFAHELLIPPAAQPTDDQLSGIINISYELRVEAVLRGFFKNLVINLPFKLFSHAPENAGYSSRPPGYPDRTLAMITSAVGGGNPFDTSTHGITMATYPSLDSSIGSPSHSSSQYSQSESSSMNSITSGSSAATLSPAVGCNELSYESGTSSQFNSPSARASLRSSTVPYVSMYPDSGSSPLMISSYPPAQVPTYSSLSESPAYARMPLSGTPPPSVFQSSPTQSQAMTTVTASNSRTTRARNSFLQGMQPPGAHELPPSYEELFGNASAPPATPK